MVRPHSLAPGSGLSMALSATVLLGLFGSSVAAGLSFPPAGARPAGVPAPGALPVSASELARPAAAVAPAAAAPVLSSPGASPSAASLSWTRSTSGSFVNYTLFESTRSADGPWTVVAAITTAATDATSITSLEPGADYWWAEQTWVTSGLLGLTDSDTQSNTLATVQPTLAYLNATEPTSTVVTLNWTNNATYGGLIAFASYAIVEKVGSGAWTSVQRLTDVAPETANVSGLVPSSSYAFYVNTTDCVSGCGTAGAVDVVTASNVVTAGTPEPLSVTLSVERSVVDAGESDYFSCTPSGGKSPYSFDWQFGDLASFVSGSSGESQAFSDPGSPTVTCQVRDAGSVVSNASTTVLVNPALSVSVSLNRTTADIGQSIGFGCDETGGTAPFTLGWSFGDGSSALTANTSHVYDGAGNFGAACAVEDGAGETVLNTSTVEVSTDPVAVLTISSLASAPNATLSFSVSLLNGSTPYASYGISFGDGTTAAGASASHAFHEIGNYTVAGHGRDANGVAARTTEIVHVTTLTLAVVPPAIATLRPSTSYSFAALPSGGAGAPYTVAWSFGDGTTATGTTPAHAYAKAGTFTVTVEATDRLGSSVFRNLSVAVVAPVKAPSLWSDPWLLLIPAGLLGAVSTDVARRRYRAHESKELSGAAQYVLPTDPERTITGVRKCRNCGTTNSAVRETCGTCGATLPRPGLFG